MPMNEKPQMSRAKTVKFLSVVSLVFAAGTILQILAGTFDFGSFVCGAAIGGAGALWIFFYENGRI
jgi:hypothetical protein